MLTQRPDGCVAAILSSNMALWHTPKNTMSWEWVKLYDITPFVAELAAREPYAKTEQTLRSQIISMAGSSHVDFYTSPAPR
ncbi:hypothetical protein B0H17DRAFT_1190222 [Mycena rosella]|uniref:Uncharacterized protein n=1 Tax=Mycena rosella TaxID=1033263 RepID=A0AAD7H215_MYCRO|nr:hypothetical protein B0H17DRAFT_1190222 [Mycena rosella]